MNLCVENPRRIAFDTWIAIANELYSLGQELLVKRQRAAFWSKPDGSRVSDSDLFAEAVTIACLQKHAPPVCVLTEERDAHASVTPPTSQFISLDPIDDSRGYERNTGMWGTLVALIVDGTPGAGIFIQPCRERFLVAMCGHGVWRRKAGSALWERLEKTSRTTRLVSLSFSSDPVVLEKTRRYHRKFRSKYGHAFNSPSGHAGADVVTGATDAWLAMARQKHWDMAATAAMLLEIGGVVHHIDGSPVRWDRVSMDAEKNPIVFARSLEKALEISEAFD